MMLYSGTLVLLAIQFSLIQDPSQQFRKPSITSVSEQSQHHADPSSNDQAIPPAPASHPPPGSPPPPVNSIPFVPDATSTACVKGKVRYGGIPVAGATVLLYEVTLGVTYHTTTSPHGSYKFCALMAGDYSLKAQSSTGTVEESISLKRDQKLSLDLKER
jgi:hypothetical protein